jgi:MSHA biogenesis protein MshP
MKRLPLMALRQRGFSIVSAIFLLVVLAALGVAIVSVSTTQNVTSAQDIQGSRAYHAARAGAEWGVFQVMNPAGTLAPSPPVCPANATLAIEGFAVTVTCSNYGPYRETTGVAQRTIVVYVMTSTATSSAAVGSVDYVERQAQVMFSKCILTQSSAPNQLCS